MTFTAVHTEGSLLPMDLLERIVALDERLEGLSEGDYRLAEESLGERIARAFNRCVTRWGTRDAFTRWLLGELGYGAPLEDQSRASGSIYIHPAGHGLPLDRRGAGAPSPHSWLQALLNRSDAYTWGLLSNGLQLRLLRKSARLGRPGYVEFDLERMMEERSYRDFTLLWLLCHATRFAEEMWLEKWSQTAQAEGIRALDRLRAGVQEAIVALGRGLLASNRGLRERLESGEMEPRAFYRQLLRMAYRLIFLCVAEDRTCEVNGVPRSILLVPDASEKACARYRGFYSMRRLRRMAWERCVSRHGDLYGGLRVVMKALGSDAGCPDLALPALGGFLWSDEAVADILHLDLQNVALLDAVRALSVAPDGGTRRAVDYRRLGAEELGSVYESLLALHPEVDRGDFRLGGASGSDRKTTGSYYTPACLIECLLDSALDPVLEEGVSRADAEAAILGLKVCDPACGSGHFLIAAAHRIARRLAWVRTGDEEPAPPDLRKALRDVVSHCLYGVDLNEMAVELCKVSLWMESLEPGEPLSFLDHRITCGNSLVGAPGDRLQWDDADAWCAATLLKTQDALPEVERLAARHRFFHWHLAFPEVFARGGFDVLLGNPPWERIKLQEQEWFAKRCPDVARASTAAIRKKSIAVLEGEDPALHALFLDARRRAEEESHFVRHSGLYPQCGRGDVNRYALFAERMRGLLRPGGLFGVVLPSGIATDDSTRAFFSELTSSRSLKSLWDFENEELLFPAVHHAFKFCLLTAARPPAAFDRASFVFFARQPGDVRDHARVFTLDAHEIELLNPNSRTSPIFRSKRHADLNKDIYRRVPVLLVGVAGEGPPSRNSWGLRFMRLVDMANDSKWFAGADRLAAEGWTREENRFVRDGEVQLPLYEAKMVHQYDHRFGTHCGQTDAQANQGKLPELGLEDHADPCRVVQPRYWMPAAEIARRLGGRWARKWFLGWRNITNAKNERTLIASILPMSAVGHSEPLMFSSRDPRDISLLYANLCSFVLDYCARQKVGGTNFTYGYLMQLPVLPPSAYDCGLGLARRDFIRASVLELVYSSWDIHPFALDCGHDGPPFPWDQERRFHLRCRLDAIFFKLYGIDRENVAGIMDTFPIVRRKDEAKHGEYRTRRVVLEYFDQEACPGGVNQAGAGSGVG